MSRTTRSDDAPPRFPGRRVPAEAEQIDYRYGSVRVLRDDRIRLDARTRPGAIELNFSVRYVYGLADGTFREDKHGPRIHASMPEKDAFFMLFVDKDRVQSTCFNYGLTPDQLRKGIALLLKARGGLERWIVPGLVWTSRTADNPHLVRACRAAIRSLRKRIPSSPRAPVPLARRAVAG